MAEDPDNSTLVLHPTDYGRLKALLGNDNLLPGRPPPDRLWGLPVVLSPAVPPGTAFMGDLASIDTVRRCGCCGAKAEEGGCFSSGGYPMCVCYLQAGRDGPELCSYCETCAYHHNGLPFGACMKSDLSQRVIKLRIAEREGRASRGAEES